MSDILTGIKRAWRTILGTATWLFAVTSTFVLPPSFLDPKDKDDAQWILLSRFAVAIIVGIFVVLATRFSGKKYIILWTALSFAFLLGTIASLLFYDDLLVRYTVIYPIHSTRRVVVGTTYSERAARFRDSFKSKNGGFPTDTELVWENNGPGELWAPEEIESRARLAVLIYILCVILPTCCVLSICYALSISSQTKRDRNG
jgi:hypothetical protein